MAYIPPNINGQATMANSLPVVIATNQTALPITGSQTTPSTVAWTSATLVNTAITIPITNLNTVTVSVSNTSTMTAGVLVFEISPDGTNWFQIAMGRIDSFTVETSYSLNTVANRAWSTSVDAFTNFRVRLSATISGTGTATVIIAAQLFAIEPVVTIGQSVAAALQTTSTIASIAAGTNLIGKMNLTTQTTGGATSFTQISTASTNANVVKTSAGVLYMLVASNNSTVVAFLKIYNKASAPTVGTDVPVMTFMLPANSGITVPVPATGITFATGIAFAITGLATTADTTSVALNQVQLNGAFA